MVSQRRRCRLWKFNFRTSVAPDGEATGDDSNIFEVLGQVSSGEAGNIFRNFLRGSVRHLISPVLADEMADEMAALCGPKHRPTEAARVVK